MSEPIHFTDDITLPGPLRLIVHEFRGICGEKRDTCGDLQAAELLGAGKMAIRWIGLYAGFVFTFGECEAARRLILAEVRYRMDVLTKQHGCPRARGDHRQN